MNGCVGDGWGNGDGTGEGSVCYKHGRFMTECAKAENQMDERTNPEPIAEIVEPPPHSRAMRIWNTNQPGVRGTTYDGVTYEAQRDGSMKAINKPMSRRKQQRLGLRPR